MGAIRVERGAIPPQTIRHTETSTIEPLKTGFSYRLERAVAVGIAHHRRQAQQPRVKITAELIRHHHRCPALGVDAIKVSVPQQSVEVGA